MEGDTQLPGRRILSIDGGGILGAFPAAFLAALEQHLAKPIGSYFDLIAGTSTGGIIAIGLAMGLSAAELLSLYERRGPEIFGQGRGPILNFISGAVRLGRWIVANKHDSSALQCVLEDVLGEKRIGDAKTRLLIPAWNPVVRSVYIYKTAHHPRLKHDYKALAVDAALATAAAPTYFRQHVTQHAVGLTDGGTWANNPIALAVVEAITLLGWPRDSLHVLSLGCLEETYTIRKWAGLSTLGQKVINLFMDGQSHGALGIAKLLTGDGHERTAIYRVNQTVPQSTYRMDDPTVIQDLKGLGYTLARSRQPELVPVFFRTPAKPFVPFYTLEENSSVAEKETASA